MLDSLVKFLFDENIGKTVVEYFSRAGYDVKTIIDEMQGASDMEV